MKAVRLLVVFTILAIPFKILSYGFLPNDDALRHSAKIISGRSWDEIVILRGDVKTDDHPGWHLVLGAIHGAAHCGAKTLLLFSVIALFVLFSLFPAAIMRRPEAWLAAMAAVSLANHSTVFRLMLGRPYIITMAAVVAIGFIWPLMEDKKHPVRGFLAPAALAIAVSYTHYGFYLVLPAAAFLITRRLRAAAVLASASLTGIVAAAVFTGHPVEFLSQTFRHIFFAFGTSAGTRSLVGEFQPFTGEVFTVFMICLVLLWRSVRRTRRIKVIDDPVFMLAVLGWIGGFLARRIWFDIGVASAMVWVALEFQEFLEDRVKPHSRRRLAAACAICITAFLAITNDAESRWSDSHPKLPLCAGNSIPASWLPGPGGIIYSDTNEIFFEIFFANPCSNWRYMVGFEPGLMPESDLDIFRNIQMTRKSYASFEPWVKKMRPEDRLIVRRVPGDPMNIIRLEWYYAGYETWIGRLPGG